MEAFSSASRRSALEVYLTDHAIQRYRERVRPGLTLDRAADELEHVLPYAEVFEEPPRFAVLAAQRSELYAALGDGIAVALNVQPNGEYVAVTVLTNAGTSDGARARRNERGRRRRERRRLRRSKAIERRHDNERYAATQLDRTAP